MDYDRAKDIIHHAERPLVITGAGISVDSGLPVYTGDGGIYNDKDIVKHLTVGSGVVDFSKVWDKLLLMAKSSHVATCNAGHRALVAWERARTELIVLSQNVDGLHSQSGQVNLVELHGALRKVFCGTCGYKDDNFDYYKMLTDYPVCQECGKMMRPDVVLFGESIPRETQDQYYNAIQNRDLVMVIGTSAGFEYIQEPVKNARYRGVPVIELNTYDSQITKYADITFREPSTQCLTRLITKEVLKPVSPLKLLSKKLFSKKN